MLRVRCQLRARILVYPIHHSRYFASTTSHVHVHAAVTHDGLLCDTCNGCQRWCKVDRRCSIAFLVDARRATALRADNPNDRRESTVALSTTGTVSHRSAHVAVCLRHIWEGTPKNNDKKLRRGLLPSTSFYPQYRWTFITHFNVHSYFTDLLLCPSAALLFTSPLRLCCFLKLMHLTHPTKAHSRKSLTLAKADRSSEQCLHFD